MMRCDVRAHDVSQGRAARQVVAILYLVGMLLALPTVAWDQNEGIGHQIFDGEGVAFSQVTFSFPGGTVTCSSTGRAKVTVANVENPAGWDEAYLNVVTETGWVVFNLWIDFDNAPGSLVTYFDLGVADRTCIETLQAYVSLHSEPLDPSSLSVSSVPLSMFSVGRDEWDAEGLGDYMTKEMGAPPPAVEEFLDELQGLLPGTSGYLQPNRVNEQAARGQCGPMATANSLQYLEDRFGVSIPHDHRPGLGGDDSLVGTLDSDMGREIRRCGGVTESELLSGKFKYLSENGLTDALVHRHQGRGVDLPVGKFDAHGIQSVSDGSNVTFEWLCEQVRAGEDVELGYRNEDAAGNIDGGHFVRVVGCGTVLGMPYIIYAHDALQQDDTRGLETVVVFLWDLDGDGMLNFGRERLEVDFALSESLKPPSVSGSTENSPPVARVSCPRYSTAKPPADVHFVGERLSFDTSGSSDQDGSIVSHAWDFGDGCTEEGSRVHHTFEEAGTYSVCVTVTDDDGATDVDCCSVDIYVDIGGG